MRCSCGSMSSSTAWREHLRAEAAGEVRPSQRAGTSHALTASSRTHVIHRAHAVDTLSSAISLTSKAQSMTSTGF